MLAPMLDAARELWAWTREHGWMLFLASVAAYAQQHYDLYGPPAHPLILPSLAVAIFFAFPLWAAIVHDRSDVPALTIGTLGVSAALAPALVWAYGPGGKDALKADPMPLVIGATVGATLLIGAAARSGLDWSAWGLGRGDPAWWRRPVLILLTLIVVSIPIVAWIFPEFVSFYPRYKPSRTDWVALLQYQVAMGVYMFCWEFFFRGFMLFGLARTMGPVAAIVIQAYPFFVLHHDKPEPEMASSWFGGILMGWLCWRSKCMWPSFLLHWVLYSTMELTAFTYRNLLGP